MSRLKADRLFFYILLLLVILLTLYLIWQFTGAVVLAITVAVVLQPMHRWFMRRTGDRKGLATALTLLSTVVLVVIPVLAGTWLLFEALVTLSRDVDRVMQEQQSTWLQQVARFDEWVSATGLGARLQLETGDVTRSIRELVSDAGRSFVNWLAAAGLSIFSMVLPGVVFFSLLGTLLSNTERAIQVVKDLSPLDDTIDQLFMDRMRIITKSMMLSIVVVAVVQGAVTGLLMALGGTPHIVGLTLLATIFAILPGGAAIVGVPVGFLHIMVGNTWSGIIIILGTLTLVASLANQVRPLLISKEVNLNRAFMLMSVFSGLALFGFMGVVYGPLIMILFTTTIEVYLAYFRPGPPSVTVAAAEASDELDVDVHEA